MEVDQGKPSKFPQITVVISGITVEQTKTNEEDAASTLNIDEGDAAAEQGGVLVHKDIAGILSRRTLALEVRIDKIEKEIRTLKSNFNARLTRIEDKMKTLLKGQEEILSKMQELEHIQPVTTQADSGLPAQQGPETPVASIPNDSELQQSKRMRVGGYSASIMAEVLRTRYRRPVKSNTRTSARSKSSLVKYYKMMRAKQAAQATPSPVILDEAISGSPARELDFGSIGSSSGAHP